MLLALLTLLMASLGLTPASAVAPVPLLVPADVETAAVAHSGDAADDPAIWVSPSDPAASLILGNDKRGALETYNLDGSLHQRITTAISSWGNVDVRQRVAVGARVLDVVVAYNGGLRMFTVDAATRMLAPVTDSASGTIPTKGGEGLCLYDSPATGDLSAFVITRPGHLRQFRIHDEDGNGLLGATLVREFDIGSESEGCVADEATGALYVSEESVALWHYGAEPDAGTARTAVDRVQPDGHQSHDIEGVTVAGLADGTGYVIASAQNAADPSHSYFTVYDRRTNAYRTSFRVGRGATADSCERTDGVAAYAGDLGPAFPYGVFVCQDNSNTAPGAGYQDFKLVRLEKVVDVPAGDGNISPSASFSADCSGPTCSFDGGDSADTDGSVVGWTWDFGDGTTGSGPAVSHTYATSRSWTVTLTVSDDDGATGSTSRVVSPTSQGVSFVGAASANGNNLRHAVRIPPSVQAGDALLLFFAGNTDIRTISGPAGWTLLRQAETKGAVGRLWQRVATSPDAGSTVTVTASGRVKADLTVVAYRGMKTEPVGDSAVALDVSAKTSHTTPNVSIGPSGGWLLSYWAGTSSTATSWTLPAGQTRRSATTGTGSGYISATLADTGAALEPGPAGGLTATSDGVSSRTVMFSVALAAD